MPASLGEEAEMGPSSTFGVCHGEMVFGGRAVTFSLSDEGRLLQEVTH